jgi:superfamily II DNA or RNA helicase
MLTLSFDQGTLLMDTIDDNAGIKLAAFIWDERVKSWRAEGFRYRDTVLWLRQNKIPFIDKARRYDPAALRIRPITSFQLFDYQEQAVAAWQSQGRRGIVVLPTGAGKTVVALKAISLTERPTIIVVPTLDLVNQWYHRLTDCYGIEIGIVGQGAREIRDLTVITYQSAYRCIGEIGARFGLLVLDEVHHMTAPHWAEIARLAIAPFRLGLTATYDPRASEELNRLIGPLAFWKPVRELRGTRLAPYEVIRLSVELSVEERRAYEREESVYQEYWDENPRGRGEEREKERSGEGESGRASEALKSGYKNDGRLELLVREQSRDLRARRALEAWYEMRNIIAAAGAKLDMLEEIFRRHAADQAIVFAATNEMAYRISQIFLIPAITHQTKARERKSILKRFECGEYKAVVTSRVLNEGVDVPDAKIAIILGGSGSSREHTQRLGRILRQKANKLAVLYEVTVRATIETGTSRRRRQNEAYAGRANRISRL